MAEGSALEQRAPISTTVAEDVVVGALPDSAPEADRQAWLAAAQARIREHGLIVIRDALSASVVDTLLADFRRRYDVHMRPGQTKLFRNFQTDPLRAQIPVAIEGPVADPAVFAAPSVMAVVRSMMSDDLIVGENGVVISHPGAGPQNTHRDSDFLFGGLDREIDLPPHSMTLLIPLVDVSLGMGPTEFWPGSHRRTDEAVVTAVAPLRLPLAAGTALLLDARLLHRGGANVSGPVRPSVYFSYHRRWYLENPGYESKPQVRVTPAMLAKLPEAYRPLFSWALHLNRTDSVEEFLFRWLGRLRSLLMRLKGGR